MTDDPWLGWAERRPPFAGVHLDTGAAGRSSRAVLDAVAGHALREATVGGYVAAEEAAAAIEDARAALGGLLGMPAGGVAFVGGGMSAFDALLAAWPIVPDATVGVVAAEWGPNLQALARAGLRAVPLDADPAGRVDLDGLRRRLGTRPPSVVLLSQVAAHRGLVQPVAAAVEVCRDAGVPLWVDAAQALGHVATDTGADAIWSTSRKWLTGPRGVGVLAIAERRWDALRVERPVMAADGTPPQWIEWGEAHVAGRVGLGVAVAEFLATGPAAVYARLAEVGRLTRAELADLPGWRADTGEGAITALTPTAGQDVVAVRRYLWERAGILTTAALPVRAPGDATGPTLRVSPHVDGTADDLRRLRAALATAP